MVTCVVGCVLVVGSQCLGVLEGNCGDRAEKGSVFVLSFFIEFAYVSICR